jgi:hypothetical protein
MLMRMRLLDMPLAYRPRHAGAAAFQQGKKPVPVATWATPSIVKKMASFDSRIGLFRRDRPVAHHAGGIPQQRAHRAPTVFADRLSQLMSTRPS